MTKNVVFRKGLVIGLIILFIGSSVAYSTTNLLKDKNNSGYDNLVNFSDNVFPKFEFDEGKKTNLCSQTSSFNGYTLFSPGISTTTYLINNDCEVLYTWDSDFFPGHSCYLLENGNLLRASHLGLHPTFFSGGMGGGVQEIDLNNTLVWNFIYSDTYYLSHH